MEPLIAQSKAVKKYLKEEEENQKASFPEVLSAPYPEGSLGEKIQTLYEEQAKNACSIIRTNQRLYIPKEIVIGYGDDKLRATKIYDIPISARNLLFLALTQTDITKIINGTFVEQDYIGAKRIVGINDNLINYGQSLLSPIVGFPSLFFQKSCGSYFVGDLTASVNAPVAELKASLERETKKSTSITTVTGNFFSPLYLILRQNSPQSLYAHLLIYEIYHDQHKANPTSNELLYQNGKYISEFKATLTNRSLNSEESTNMNGRISAGISLGVFNANGNIEAGFENKVSFELKDFHTSIHKLSNNNLNWETSNLPKITEINQKLQNSINYKAQPSMTGFVSHLIPTEITRFLVSIPESLCDKDSWYVPQDGFDSNIWKTKPIVTSTYVGQKDGNYPECICKITGFIQKSAIDKAASSNGFIELSVLLENVNSIDENKLSINVTEPVVRVTDNPKISSINSESINANRQEVRLSNKIQFNYPIQFIINSTGIKLTEPYKISNIQIEYLSKESQQFTIHSGPNVNENTVKMELRSPEKPLNYVIQGELTIPIIIKFNIEIMGGTTTQLVTNTINLVLPNLIEPIEIKPSEGQ